MRTITSDELKDGDVFRRTVNGNNDNLDRKVVGDSVTWADGDIMCFNESLDDYRGTGAEEVYLIED